MVKVFATREIRHAGKRVLPGEAFDASEKDAKIYVAVKRATLAPAEPPALPRSIQTMTAPPPPEPVEEAAPAAPAHPQMYARRDMVAEPMDGPTGQAGPSPSSPRGRRPRAST